MRRFLPVLLVGLGLGAWAGLGVADPPGAAPSPPTFRAAVARANPYPVTPEAGPWMICAASYSGPDAPELARQLVVELRNRHHLPAYIFNHADEERKKQKAELDRLRQLHPDANIRRRTIRVEEGCAVLVGGYPSVEKASAALKTVQKLPMPDLKLENGKSPFAMMLMASPDPEKKMMALKRAPVNPFSTSFVVRNPTVPAPAKRKSDEPDPFLKELNAEEEYSLLKCPKPWTLAVKEYYGFTTIQPMSAPSSSGFLKVLGLGGHKPGEGLGAAAQQAHELARVLRDRRLGFESYVLHARRSSIVTVGGFTGPNDPELERTYRRLTKLRFSSKQGAGDPIGLFATPMPMRVPKF